MDFFIFGSCVSRDIFNYTSDDRVVDYFARSSIVSLVSEPLVIDDDLISLESEFKKKMLKRDLEKDFFEVLKNSESDYLIFDFVDERLDLLLLDGKYCTRSNELVSSGLEQHYKFQLIKKNSPEILHLWTEACKVFVDRLIKIVPESKIILHKATWAKKIFDNGEESGFDNNYNNFIDFNNRLLSSFYDYFNSLLPNINVLEINEELRVANKNHRWGLAPFHYIDEYYLEALKQLKEYKS